MPKPILLIITPYLAGANNGNWRTAQRWAKLLSPDCRVIVQAGLDDADDPMLREAAWMIALHARRSHSSIVEWRARRGPAPLIVAMTGTDLYRDVPAGDSTALDSIATADALIVLQPDAIRHLPEVHRDKARVVLQSARSLVHSAKPSSRLNCVMVGHLRAEKDPLTAFGAWRALPADEPIFLRHIGGALDHSLGDAADAFMRVERRYRWVGALAHAAARQAIRRAHLLLLPSVMEGGANVVVEAITAGTPVLGSRMSGNIGMLGDDYPGLFPVGDSEALAALLLRCRREPVFLRRLQTWCKRRAPLFSPENERRALLGVLREYM